MLRVCAKTEEWPVRRSVIKSISGKRPKVGRGGGADAVMAKAMRIDGFGCAARTEVAVFSSKNDCTLFPS